MPQNADGRVISHWHILFDDFSTSTQDFYRAVEEAIRSRNIPDIEISRTRFKEGHIATTEREYLRVSRHRTAFDICSAPFGSGHFFSWWIAKIPARYGLVMSVAIAFALFYAATVVQMALAHIFRDSCLGAFFALGGFFAVAPVLFVVLGFLVERGIIGDEEWVLSLPVLGYLYALAFNPTAYYRLDTALMFRDSVARAVAEVINGLREERGLRALMEEELQPSAPKLLE